MSGALRPDRAIGPRPRGDNLKFLPHHANPSYITGVAYTTNYYNHLSPHWLNLIAATNGMPALPLDRDYAYCEIGCGPGFTTNQASPPIVGFWAIHPDAGSSQSSRYAAGISRTSLWR